MKIEPANRSLPVMAALAALCICLSPTLASADKPPAWQTTPDGVRLIKQTSSSCSGFPIVIKDSGSYRLSSNVTSTCASKHVIDIQTDRVTLDLNGFVIEGPVDPSMNNNQCAGPSAPDSNVINAHGKKGIVIRNGTVMHSADDGINVGPECKIEDVRVLDNCGEGINGAEGCLIKHNVVEGNFIGIEAEDGASLIGNVINDNRDCGVECDLRPQNICSGAATNADEFCTPSNCPGTSCECLGNACKTSSCCVTETPGTADKCFITHNVFRNNSGCVVLSSADTCGNDATDFVAVENSCDGTPLP